MKKLNLLVLSAVALSCASYTASARVNTLAAPVAVEEEYAGPYAYVEGEYTGPYITDDGTAVNGATLLKTEYEECTFKGTEERGSKPKIIMCLYTCPGGDKPAVQKPKAPKECYKTIQVPKADKELTPVAVEESIF